MKENLKLFLHLLYITIFKKKHRREKAEAEAKAKKIVDDKFSGEAKNLAQEMVEMNKACKKQNPVNYLQKMQPYFIMIDEFMKAKKCGPIEAAMSLVTPKTKPAQIVWIYGTAAEIVNNLKPENK